VQGIFIPTGTGESPKNFPDRAKSKAALKRVIEAHGLGSARLERTALAAFGSNAEVGEYNDTLAEVPAGDYFVAGPDPYQSRNWYAKIEVRGEGDARTVKVS
jgi:hypothetical protein